MKAFLVACVVIAAIAVGASVMLDKYQQDADAAYTMPSSVRI
jgi:hypothetical protein